ncbi:hypothetical protein [Salinivibrio socompensis]|uniref:hypothetical protein n=1 Tax=Salinivibrio socompensis TaxID=1510206 RepID=UPI0004BB177F|nr:hypothetical protein [Salinivibrio socompensis]
MTVDDVLDGQAIDAAITRRYQRASYLPERAIEDIHKGQDFYLIRAVNILAKSMVSL